MFSSIQQWSYPQSTYRITFITNAIVLSDKSHCDCSRYIADTNNVYNLITNIDNPVTYTMKDEEVARSMNF